MTRRSDRHDSRWWPIAAALALLTSVGGGGCGSSASSPGGSGGKGGSSSGSGGLAGGGGSGGASATGGSGGGNTDAGTGGGPSGGSGGNAGTGGSPGNPDGGGITLPGGTPTTVHLDGAQLATLQKQLAGGSGGSPEQKLAFDNLIAAAQVALKSGTWSVTTKAAAYVVNNDPRLYVSWGPYWWPPDANPPGTPGTLGTCPYVSHDGIRNPNVAMITDRHGLHASSEAIFELALAWYLTGDPAYADQAELVARTWYLDPSKSMKPEMSNAQRHGPCGAGSAAGLIESAGGYLTDALDGLSILALDTRPNGWTAADQTGVKDWMRQYLNWVQTSAIGTAEGSAINNHGTWYDSLVASIDLYIGDSAAAKTVLNAAKQKRIDSQINGDGSMPEELSRTTSWHYSNYNASGMCHLAEIGKRAGVDLWGYQSPGGGSIAKAIAFLIPTATTASPPGPWAQYGDITSPFDKVYQAESYYSIRAAAQYGNNPAAQAVVNQKPIPIVVPGHYCSGDRFPTGSDFCAITKGAAVFTDLQNLTTPAVDMWPIIPTCRMPIN
ncbi:MAG TPA: alginate lyase family protein [Polyangia bacterium]|nr:alginate lyase family protein [Polyangia bacterium]